ncbi:uncharacterized protein PHALS_15347 [Plasmopara halstedii]|uniref:RxLR-like protein n=1 Tax=Plasmopara halstedii TaxID=4781 RepID=A0A0P1AEH9_PLAHL|nr:uncharacterized protein PHALS_15347 [Plasmopara halstedii]CEG38952.1 hypothetical protein PHALS_15347 [Plasmopara halstedii]|eukprot:XP_024575321.1 hypothetical protein PHALS_15347 [Plasmopara halstedii]
MNVVAKILFLFGVLVFGAGCEDLMVEVEDGGGICATVGDSKKITLKTDHLPVIHASYISNFSSDIMLGNCVHSISYFQ